MDKTLNLPSCYLSDEESTKVMTLTSEDEKKSITTNDKKKTVVKRKQALSSSDEEGIKNKKKLSLKRKRKIKKNTKKNNDKPEKCYTFSGGNIFKESVLLNHFKNAIKHTPIIFFPCSGHYDMATEKKD